MLRPTHYLLASFTVLILRPLPPTILSFQALARDHQVRFVCILQSKLTDWLAGWLGVVYHGIGHINCCWSWWRGTLGSALC
jgi:hypothetical protein